MNEPKWINKQVILDLHDLQIKNHGGSHGLRDTGLFDSALAQPQQAFHYQEPPPNMFELAATYTHSIAKNHAFIDGNKRTAFITGVLFLAINAIELALSEDEAYHLVRALAAGEVSKEQYAVWLESINAENGAYE